jgi:hypothetical protein
MTAPTVYNWTYQVGNEQTRKNQEYDMTNRAEGIPCDYDYYGCRDNEE